ncbi:N-acetylmuramic acid 6-phosphate etherase [Haliovirga abyssi]|uniref:N-acetylmuramic acid 6-phosphate etherase n=1 Tax=Haliovirga abyssi TaxID=2996794 RepID=A0AAU9DYP2_9FUSO|nr:N-acetylmuramic acid 6-phosphate etherase [Haliovirga abyssi]BDU51646.1 N-acetylmuramic acid 6-phosphate etherase [Haliovirga abyssi]
MSEDINRETINIDSMNSLEIVEKMNNEDKKIAFAVEYEKHNIAKSIDLITEKLSSGGKLFYVGSGTSGKLGVIDASECPPTFGVDDKMVQGIISGGKDAISGWLEQTEDNEELAISDLKKYGVTKKDVIVGISASGNTPYVISALKYAKSNGISTVGICCKKTGKIRNIVDVDISVEVGAEVIMGSTRLKSGTAQKMILNMISTGVMIRLGKVYGNLMINVQPINKKLQNRLISIVALATEINKKEAERILLKAENNPKLAIIMIENRCDLQSAKTFLEKHNNIITRKTFMNKEE